MKLANGPQKYDGKALFGWRTDEKDGWPPVLIAGENARLSAHALATEFAGRKPLQGVHGEIEPLVGRETIFAGRFGVNVSEARVCYSPGGKVAAGMKIRIGDYGIWEARRGTAEG